jgi:hypothetical protein
LPHISWLWKWGRLQVLVIRREEEFVDQLALPISPRSVAEVGGFAALDVHTPFRNWRESWRVGIFLAKEIQLINKYFFSLMYT